MVNSYEIYETSLGPVSLILYEMTTSVKFSLSYDLFKLDFIAPSAYIISTRKHFVDTDVVNDVTSASKSVITRR